jgi:glycerate 2-kinase
MHADRFLTRSLRDHPQGYALAEIMAAALAAVDPTKAVQGSLRRDGDALLVADLRYKVVGRVIVVGAGKAGAPMAQAAAEVLGDRVSTGLVIVKEGHLGATSGRLAPIRLLEGSHPVPDQRNIVAAARLAELLQELQEDDLVLVLISGGGSALLTLPAPGLTLTDLQALTTALLRSGATIGEINTLRKHCTQLTGGQLARLAAPAQVVALIVSDVVGSPLDVIASGPTTPDPTTFTDAWAVVQRYNLQQKLPAPVIDHLQRGLAGDVAETPKPDEPVWERVHNEVVASNIMAAETAITASRQRGFNALLLTTFLEGEAREVGRVVTALARELALRNGPLARPALVVAGGETTVTLRGGGLGGRNQELALGAVAGLAGLPGVLLIALATDGGDGPTDAAGAVVTGDTLARAQALGLDPVDFLVRNDAYHFFAALDDLLRPGPTLTNVNDLLFIAALDA